MKSRIDRFDTGGRGELKTWRNRAAGFDWQIIEFLGPNILGDIDQHRARPTACCACWKVTKTDTEE